MSRRNSAIVREVLPDPKFNSVVVTKLINQIMLDGKRTIAQNIVYEAFDTMEQKLGKPAMEIFNQALENVKPILEVKARRVGGSTYQVPMEIRAARRQTLAIRWLTDASRKRTDRTMAGKLASELMDAFNSTGGAFKKKEEVHRMAEANKAFASYKW